VRAVDSNVLVRLIARDDPDQLRVAREIMAAGDVLVLPTVVLEAEWVLRSRYRVSRQEIAERLRTILGQPGLTVASAEAVATAMAAYENGGDFADLLHSALAAERGASILVTFDRAFASAGALEVSIADQVT
jgi:predicted nucleic-acid-binding protein